MDTASHPVERVSWNDAAEFCAKLSEQEKLKPFYFRGGETVTMLAGTGYRLPTEAEWEFACRAGTTTKYWIGDKDEDLTQAAWFGANSGGRTHAVGELKANPFGLYDIHGNVCEWVQDWWGPTYYGQFQGNPARNPSGPSLADSRRVLRGGDWLYTASHCRAANRNNHGANVSGVIGFRVALTVDAVKAATKGQSAAMGPAIDLLAMVDLSRDTVENERYGKWTRDGQTLISPGGNKAGHIMVPYLFPAEYELTALVERLEGNDGVIFGFVMDGHAAQIGFDIHDPKVSGVGYIDGKYPLDNESAYRKAVLADRKPHTIRVTVGKRSVRGSVDGQEVVNWEGDPNRLTSPVSLSDDKNVSFGTGFNKFKFHKLELRPLSPALAHRPPANRIRGASWRSGCWTISSLSRATGWIARRYRASHCRPTHCGSPRYTSTPSPTPKLGNLPTWPSRLTRSDNWRLFLRHKASRLSGWNNSVESSRFTTCISTRHNCPARNAPRWEPCRGSASSISIVAPMWTMRLWSISSHARNLASCFFTIVRSATGAWRSWRSCRACTFCTSVPIL